jgi:hypothetical protein
MLTSAVSRTTAVLSRYEVMFVTVTIRTVVWKVWGNTENLREDSRFPVWELNPVPPEYVVRRLVTRPWCLVAFRCGGVWHIYLTGIPLDCGTISYFSYFCKYQFVRYCTAIPILLKLIVGEKLGCKRFVLFLKFISCCFMLWLLQVGEWVGGLNSEPYNRGPKNIPSYWLRFLRALKDRALLPTDRY